MRTTVNVDEHVLADAKRLAAATGKTLGELIEDALREALARRREPPARRPVDLPTFRGRGGVLPGVDLDDSAALLDVLERDE